METIAPKPSDFPEMDATLVKCIAYMQVGGKESRRSLKEMIENLNWDKILVVVQSDYIEALKGFMFVTNVSGTLVSGTD